MKWLRIGANLDAYFFTRISIFQSIFSYNGGACVAMKGEKCVAIASDLRFGQQLSTVTCDFSKAFEMAPHLWMGLCGLATDVMVY